MALQRQTQAASFRHAFEGIVATVRSELHMKVHLVVAICALSACALLRVDATGWCLVILCVGMVCSAEIANTAVEALCDKVSPEFDPHVKLAKDAAAGAVLVAALAAVAVGLAVYVPAIGRLAGWM